MFETVKIKNYRDAYYLIYSCCFYTGNKDNVCQQKSKGKIEMNKIMNFCKQCLPNHKEDSYSLMNDFNSINKVPLKEEEDNCNQQADN